MPRQTFCKSSHLYVKFESSHVFVFCSMKLESRIGKAMGYWHWRGGEGASPSEFCVSGQLKNIAMPYCNYFYVVVNSRNEGSRRQKKVAESLTQ